jgi:hypothetical protein
MSAVQKTSSAETQFTQTQKHVRASKTGETGKAFNADETI